MLQKWQNSHIYTHLKNTHHFGEAGGGQSGCKAPLSIEALALKSRGGRFMQVYPPGRKPGGAFRARNTTLTFLSTPLLYLFFPYLLQYTQI